MNKDDLHKTLIEENFNPSAYSLDDDFKDHYVGKRVDGVFTTVSVV
jgi:hypothetical protein